MCSSARNSPPVLLLAITAHGYGHASQSAAVVNRLRERCPELQLIIVADLPLDWLRGRFAGDFLHVALATDPGLPMKDPLNVDWEQAASAYNKFLAQSGKLEQRLAELIGTYRVNLVLADVPWVPLQVASLAGVPAVAMCSLNWADILRESPADAAAVASVIAVMEDAYQKADVFIRTEPAMPMGWLQNISTVGPVAKLGKDYGEGLRSYLGLDDAETLGLSQFGGIDGMRPLQLPSDHHVHWILSKSTSVGLQASSAEEIISELDLTFVDLIASVDLMLTKPGYGSFAEAACNGTRVLYVERAGWPEAPYLESWIQQRTPSASITTVQLCSGDYADELDRLLEQPRARPVPAQGVDQAVELLFDHLRLSA